MKFTPSSTARRKTFFAFSRSLGSSQIPSPVIRIAPKPNRLTIRSPPIANVPLAFAFTSVVLVVVIPLSDAGCRAKVHRFALFQNFYLSLNAEPNRFGFEAFQRFVHRLPAQPKGAIVHWDHLFCAEVDKSAYSLFGIGVDRAMAIRKIGSDRQQRQLGFQASANLAKAVEVSRLP